MNKNMWHRNLEVDRHEKNQRVTIKLLLGKTVLSLKNQFFGHSLSMMTLQMYQLTGESNIFKASI